MTYLSDFRNGFENGTSDSSLSWVDGTRTFTVAPNVGGMKVWSHGRPFAFTADQSVVVPDVTGLYALYFDKDGVLTATSVTSLTDSIVTQDALAGVVYWNATQGTAVLVGDERHGLMDTATHLHLHESFGSQLQRDSQEGLFALTGIEIDGAGDDNGNAQIAMEPGTLRDEDLRLRTDATSQVLGTPAATTPLDSAPTVPAEIPVIWRAGTNGDWTIQRAADKGAGLPAMLDVSQTVPGYAGSLQPWNEDTGSTWQLTEPSSPSYILLHLYAWNDIDTRVVGVVGQAAYASAADAREGARFEILNVSLQGLPFPEFAPLYSLVVQTESGYTNDAKATFEDAVSGGGPNEIAFDWRFGFVPRVQ